LYSADGILQSLIFDKVWKNAKRPIILVGHITFQETLKIKAVDEKMGNKRALHCITQLRHPINRTVSCFHYRSQEVFHRKTAITDYTPSEFEYFLKFFRDKYGNGCNNEMLRMFSGLADEDTLNDIQEDSSEARLAVARAKKNIAQCIPFVVEDPEGSRKLARYWYPGLKMGDRNANEGNYSKNQEIPQAYIDVILKLNQPDLELYEFGVAQYNKLLSILPSSTYQSSGSIPVTKPTEQHQTKKKRKKTTVKKKGGM